MALHSVFCSLATMMALSATAPDPPARDYILQGGREPTVVFESGLGDGKEIWTEVLALLGDQRAFAYDRPGYGAAPFADDDGVRTSEEAATHLESLLERAGVDGPIILVGHSLGGLYALKFAERNPERVAGIVLVDGRPGSFSRACRERNIERCAKPREAPPDWPEHIRAESAGIPIADAANADPEVLGDIPVTVIVASRPGPGEDGAAAIAVWVETQQAFAARLKRARLVPAPGAGHYIHTDDPRLVADEIVRMATSIRGGNESSGD